MPARRPFQTRIRHPVSGKPIRLSALSERALEQRIHYVDELRSALEVHAKSEDEVDRELRRMTHGPVTLERAARAYLASGLADNTRRDVESFLASAGAELAPRELAAIDAPAVDAWIHKLLSKNLSPSSIRTYWRRLRAVVRFACARGFLGREPWGDYRPKLRRGEPKAREAARSLGELGRLLTAAGELDAERALRGLLPDVRAKIGTAAALGLRQGELAGLRWTDLLAQEGFVVIARQYAGDDTKTEGSVRVLAAGPELFALLGDYRRALGDFGLDAPNGPVFPCAVHSRPGHPRAYSRGECLSRRTLRAVVQRAQLPNPRLWSPHSLRDTFATLESHARRGDLRTVADRTRHASIASLLRYLRAAREHAAPAPGFALPMASAPRELPPAFAVAAPLARALPPPHPKKQRAQ